jgi:hypothetical protein
VTGVQTCALPISGHCKDAARHVSTGVGYYAVFRVISAGLRAAEEIYCNIFHFIYFLIIIHVLKSD